jgi:hypothetical protein
VSPSDGPGNRPQFWWAGGAAGPISKLKTEINNTKAVGLLGVLGLNQFGPRRRIKKKVFEFSPKFFISKQRGLNIFN